MKKQFCILVLFLFFGSYNSAYSQLYDFNQDGTYFIVSLTEEGKRVAIQIMDGERKSIEESEIQLYIKVENYKSNQDSLTLKRKVFWFFDAVTSWHLGWNNVENCSGGLVNPYEIISFCGINYKLSNGYWIRFWY